MKDHKYISQDSKTDNRKGLKDIKREFSNLQTPKHPDHAAQFRAMVKDKSADHGKD